MEQREMIQKAVGVSSKNRKKVDNCKKISLADIRLFFDSQRFQ